MRHRRRRAIALRTLVAAAALGFSLPANAVPRVILISLDGASPLVIDRLLFQGLLPADRGLGVLRSTGFVASQNVTVTPSLTAPGHIAIATGSHAAHNDVVANGFQLVASPINNTISGFGAPIGGYSYSVDGPVESLDPTAEPLWIAARAAGRTVVAATFPGADGVDVRVPGLAAPAPIVQSASRRTVDYTVPFGTFSGQGARGFSMTTADFTPAPQTTLDQLVAAGRPFFGTVMQKTTPLETFTIDGRAFDLRLAALDTFDDGRVGYDSLVVFDQTSGIQPGPFALPASGPAYIGIRDNVSAKFFFDGTSIRSGTAFYVTRLLPNLSTVRLARYGTNHIPRNAPVIASVDDANNNVGFWAPQPDFRIPERLSPGFGPFPDLELEEVYADQVRTFVDYQTRMVLRAITANPDADLVLSYIEQPDGSGHQFTLTDPRQPTDFLNPASIHGGQDRNKINRYRRYLADAYRVANEAVQAVIDEVGVDAQGRPNSNIIVVSDHGMTPFHTAVSINNLLAAAGVDTTRIRARTSGPAVNVYINLEGRQPGGTVTRQEYLALQDQVANVLRSAVDTNANYTLGAPGAALFGSVIERPIRRNLNSPDFGLISRGPVIAQDSGDVVAILAAGYNFDGTQNPVVRRLGDSAVAMPVLSVPNFYGAHGYNPARLDMSAIFYAAGPDIGQGVLPRVNNIDVAPTILRLLGVTPAATVDGTALPIGLPQ